MKSNGQFRHVSSRLHSAFAALPQAGLAAAFVFGASHLAAQTTIPSGLNSFSTETTLDLGALTRSTGGIALFSGNGTISASASLTNSILPWGIVQKSGSGANNSSNGYTFATISSGNVAAYTTATAFTTASAAPGSSATTNYDWSSTGTATIGTSRQFNTIRYTGTGITWNTNSAQTETINAFMNAGTGTVTMGGGNTMNFQSANGELVLAAMTANIVLNGPIINNGSTPGAVTVVGGSGRTVTLGGANTYTGGTTVASGTLATAANLGAANSNAVIRSGATLSLTAAGTISNTVSGAGAVTSTGATLTGNWGGFTGTYTHNSTTASTSFNSATATSKDTAYTISSAQGSAQGMIAGFNTGSLSGTYTLELGSLSGVANSLFRGGNTAQGIATLKIGNLNTSTTFDGAFANGTNTTIAVTKVGTGSLTLGGASTHTGATNVEQGALIVNGSLGNTAVTVSATSGTATLGGSGTIGGATTIGNNGILSPGNSPGVLTFSSTLGLGSGSTSVFEINGVTRGTEYDGVNVGGALTYGGTISLYFNAPVTAGTYDLFGGGFTSQSGDFSAVSIGGSAVSPTINTGIGWTYSSGGWQYDFANATGDLTVSAVPEPSAFAALAGLAGLGFAGLRRRRRA